MNVLKATELFTFKLLTLCYVNFIPIFKIIFKRKKLIWLPVTGGGGKQARGQGCKARPLCIHYTVPPLSPVNKLTKQSKIAPHSSF